jgi:hypothetical protein
MHSSSRVTCLNNTSAAQRAIVIAASGRSHALTGHHRQRAAHEREATPRQMHDRDRTTTLDGLGEAPLDIRLCYVLCSHTSSSDSDSNAPFDRAPTSRTKLSRCLISETIRL